MKSHAEAVVCFERAFAQGAEDLTAARHLADSYRQLRELGRSETWFATIVASPEAGKADYRWAQQQAANGAPVGA